MMPQRQRNKLILGTVQLGRSYGLDQIEQPTRDDAYSILDAAFSAGIDTFDTAGDYGEAIDILGEWIKERNVADKVKIISKLPPLVLDRHTNEVDTKSIIRSDIEDALRRSHLNSINYYLLNNSRYVYRRDALDALRQIKLDGLVTHIGVSTYDEDEALEAVRQNLDCVEVPYNALDQRLDMTDFWSIANDQCTTTFARSPFLQGILLMNPKQLPSRIHHINESLNQFIHIAHSFGLSQIKAALLFVLQECQADHIVFGVKTLQQLNEILEITKIEIPDGFADVVRMRFKTIDRTIVNPSLW